MKKIVFSPNDKVRFIDDHCPTLKNVKVYTIFDVNEQNLIRLKEDPSGIYWSPTRFEVVSNTVERPTHYNQGDIECIDAMASCLGPEKFSGYLQGSVFKYIWRCNYKGSKLEDLEKAINYINRLITLERSINE